MPVHSPDLIALLPLGGPMLNRLKTEPALVSSLVVAALNGAAAFGLNLSGEQTAAINAFVGVLLAIFFVRPRVTPTVTPTAD